MTDLIRPMLTVLRLTTLPGMDSMSIIEEATLHDFEKGIRSVAMQRELTIRRYPGVGCWGEVSFRD